MKYLLFIFNVIINLNAVAQNKAINHQNKSKNDLTKKNLLGEVKSLTEYYYIVTKSSTSSNVKIGMKTVSNFNSKGMLNEVYIYSGPKLDSIMSYRKYVYDDKGRHLKTVDKGGKIKRTSKYSYDINKNLVETAYSNNQRISSRIIYNKFHKRDTMYSYTRNGDSGFKIVYHYDAKSNCTEEIRYKADGSLDKKEVYIFNKENNKIQENHYDFSGVKTGKISYQYDKNRNIISQIDSNLMFIGGLPKNKIWDKIFSKTFQYDVFDKQGNWKAQNLILNDKPVIFMKREITYY